VTNVILRGHALRKSRPESNPRCTAYIETDGYEAYGLV